MRISVDVGYGYVKAVNEKSRKILFPSVVAPYTSKGLGSILGGIDDEYTVVMWEYGKPNQSKCFYVGDKAMTSGGAIRTWEDNAANNSNIKVLVMASLSILGDGSPVDLAVGLPMGFYNEQKNEIKKLFQGLDCSVNINGNGTVRTKVNSVFVFPQGAGAYYSACLNIDGTVKNPDIVNSSAGIIDIGYRTTDYLIMTKGKKGIAPREDLSDSIDIGMNLIFQSIQREIEALTKKKIEILKIEQAVLWHNCDITISGQNFNLNDIKRKACEEFAERIISHIKFKWDNEIDYLRYIFIAGGGAIDSDIRDIFTKSFNNIYLLDSYANAEGYLAAQALSAKR
ncbi:MAG: ParM/StbA family protein [Caloramator sp.]|nr:ParM/StbA family protein [Caloramator sp.]